MAGDEDVLSCGPAAQQHQVAHFQMQECLLTAEMFVVRKQLKKSTTERDWKNWGDVHKANPLSRSCNAHEDFV